jgi:hypothetical protein
MNLLELIDAYALANRRHYATQSEPGTSNGPYSPDSRETVEAAGVCLELHAEIERRLALAEADHPIIWRSHLDDNERSQSRQRALIAQHAADVAAGRRPYPVIEHCRKDL